METKPMTIAVLVVMLKSMLEYQHLALFDWTVHNIIVGDEYAIWKL